MLDSARGRIFSKSKKSRNYETIIVFSPNLPKHRMFWLSFLPRIKYGINSTRNSDWFCRFWIPVCTGMT